MAILILVIPLIIFVSYMATVSNTKTIDTISKIRCDELHYFVEDIRWDLSRAMVIFGRRAAIYSIDNIVENERPLNDYVFVCSPQCNVNCSVFGLEVNGSEAALSELMLCGTLFGNNVSFMVNHTLSQWLERIEDRGGELHFNTSIDVVGLHVIPNGPWGFTVYVNSTFDVVDFSDTCFYEGGSEVSESYTSILGLEDPIFPLHTNSYVVKFFENCTADIRGRTLAGCSPSSEPGAGAATGTLVFHSDIKTLYGGLDNYCVSRPPHIINNQILVLDQGFGGCNKYEDDVCFNASHPHSFGGIINYGPNSVTSFASKCNVTIPWITNTGDIDDRWPESPPRTVSECGVTDISAGSCIQIMHDSTCSYHKVFLGVDTLNVNTSCYRVSNASLYGGVDGPSFFDRLDGNLNLSEKYVNQSIRFFNDSMIGIETLVNMYDLNSRGLDVYLNATWVDYLYFQNEPGCVALASCPSSNLFFRLDDAHAGSLGISTECEDVDSCITSEVCVNEFDEDNDGLPDWLDYDCRAFFLGCGEIVQCDLLDDDECSNCFSNNTPSIPINSEVSCDNYGFNTSEWHFYTVSPSASGLLNIVFNGTSNVSGEEKTDLLIYNYSLSGGCDSQTEYIPNIESDFSGFYCVLEGETYVLGLDVDAPNFNYRGSYVLGVYLAENDSSCQVFNASAATTTSITSSTVSTTTTTTACVDVIIDNADGTPTYSEVGSWRDSTGTPGFYGTEYRYDRSEQRDPSKSASFTPTILVHGLYNVYLMWSSDVNRPNAAPVYVSYDGGYDDDLVIDQTVSGGVWNYLGTFDFDVGNTGFVRIEADDFGFTIADAAKFECETVSTVTTTTTSLAPSVTVPGCVDVIIDNSDGAPDYVETGHWVSSSFWPGFYGSNYRHDNNWRTDPSKSATFTPSLAVAAPYKVYMWWSAEDNRPNAAPLYITHDGGVDSSVSLDQTINGGKWNYVGRYDFTPGFASLKISGEDYGYTVADAVYFKCD